MERFGAVRSASFDFRELFSAAQTSAYLFDSGAIGSVRRGTLILFMCEADPIYYHTIELPDGLHTGPWDCRAVTEVYLGRVPFDRKTVLEVGPANGYFTFEMERRGASVVCLDLGQNCAWDLVPSPHGDVAGLEKAVRSTLARIEAAFWLAHSAVGSKAQLVYGTVYEAPRLVAPRQIGVLCNVLQHIRDPLGGLMAVAKCTQETIIVTESMWVDDPVIETHAMMQLIPRAENPEVSQSWFQVSMPLIGEMLKLLGFSDLKCEYHWPTLQENGMTRAIKHMTWVGHRK